MSGDDTVWELVDVERFLREALPRTPPGAVSFGIEDGACVLFDKDGAEVARVKFVIA